MRHVKRYKELFEAQNELSQEQMEWLDKFTRGKWTLNPQTGLVDVGGSFYCNSQNLTDFKGVRFGVVTGHFYCSCNKLTSLKDAPQKVGRGFYCFGNALTSLKDAPQEVGGDFNCSYNNLTSLKDAPQEVVVSFDCSFNELTSLRDAPKKVGGDFDCSYNNLTSLKDAPQEVGVDFHCYNNELTSLEGAPREVKGYFSCSDNPVSESVLKALYKKMQSGMSWPDAVASQWRYIRSEEDKILLAPSNPNFSPDEKAYYQAIGALKRRSI
jgi:hypothetical protein